MAVKSSNGSDQLYGDHEKTHILLQQIRINMNELSVIFVFFEKDST